MADVKPKPETASDTQRKATAVAVKEIQPSPPALANLQTKASV